MEAKHDQGKDDNDRPGNTKTTAIDQDHNLPGRDQKESQCCLSVCDDSA